LPSDQRSCWDWSRHLSLNGQSKQAALMTASQRSVLRARRRIDRISIKLDRQEA